jgi:hypothetical protein
MLLAKEVAMPMPKRKFLPLYIDAALYRQLERAGRAEERDAVQQARWILLRAFPESEPRSDEQPTGDEAVDAAAK